VGTYWYEALLPSGLKIGSPPTGSIGVQQEGAAPVCLTPWVSIRSCGACRLTTVRTGFCICSPHAVPGSSLASTAKSKPEALRSAGSTLAGERLSCFGRESVCTHHTDWWGVGRLVVCGDLGVQRGEKIQERD